MSTTGLTYLLPSNKNAFSQCAASAPRSSVSHEPVLRGMMLNENRLIIHEHAHHCNTTPSPRPSVYETIERMGLVLDSGGGLQNQQHISTELCVVSPKTRVAGAAALGNRHVGLGSRHVRPGTCRPFHHFILFCHLNLFLVFFC